jgi:hypothetical protein
MAAVITLPGWERSTSRPPRSRDRVFGFQCSSRELPDTVWGRKEAIPLPLSLPSRAATITGGIPSENPRPAPEQRPRRDCRHTRRGSACDNTSTESPMNDRFWQGLLAPMLARFPARRKANASLHSPAIHVCEQHSKPDVSTRCREKKSGWQRTRGFLPAHLPQAVKAVTCPAGLPGLLSLCPGL